MLGGARRPRLRARRASRCRPRGRLRGQCRPPGPGSAPSASQAGTYVPGAAVEGVGGCGVEVGDGGVDRLSPSDRTSPSSRSSRTMRLIWSRDLAGRIWSSSSILTPSLSADLIWASSNCLFVSWSSPRRRVYSPGLPRKRYSFLDRTSRLGPTLSRTPWSRRCPTSFCKSGGTAAASWTRDRTMRSRIPNYAPRLRAPGSRSSMEAFGQTTAE
jgi:hypothetical protein